MGAVVAAQPSPAAAEGSAALNARETRPKEEKSSRRVVESSCGIPLWNRLE